MTYERVFHDDAARSLRKIMRGDRTYGERIADEVRALSLNPRPPGVVQVRPNVFRIVVGQYRVIYTVFDAKKIILVGKIGRRNEATYRDLDEVISKSLKSLEEYSDE